MRSAMVGLALLGAAVMGTSAQAATPADEQSLLHPVWWDGGYDSDYCGPRCQEHRWWRQQRWEARRQYWQQRQWDYNYYVQPRYYGYYPQPGYYGYWPR